jgi:signal transduction histidine kinase
MKPPRSSQERRALFQFLLAGLAALVVLGVGGVFVSRAAGTREAIRNVEDLAVAVAGAVVEPNLTDALLEGDPEALARFDALMRGRVLSGSAVRVKLWTNEGRIVYSDEPRLIGSIYPLAAEELRTLVTDQVLAQVTDLSEPENRFENQEDRLLEVYMPVWAPGGTQLLYESYFSFDTVTDSSRRIWLAFAPITFGVLLVMAAIQAPLAWRMISQLRSAQREREHLLVKAVGASDTERRRIAGDLHDGVVQDLVGTSFELAALADSVDEPNEDLSGSLHLLAKTTRRSIRSLRSLVVDIYPPNLQIEGLEAALADLLSDLADGGIHVHLDVGDHLALHTDDEALIFRTAQEALRNVNRHSGAERVDVLIYSNDRSIVASVRDDGRGFNTEDVLGESADGHMGLRLLAGLAAEAGAELSILSSSGGTDLTLEIPR